MAPTSCGAAAAATECRRRLLFRRFPKPEPQNLELRHTAQSRYLLRISLPTRGFSVENVNRPASGPSVSHSWALRVPGPPCRGHSVPTETVNTGQGAVLASRTKISTPTMLCRRPAFVSLFALPHTLTACTMLRDGTHTATLRDQDRTQVSAGAGSI